MNQPFFMLIEDNNEAGPTPIVLGDLKLTSEVFREVSERLTDSSRWEGESERDLISAMGRQGLILSLAYHHMATLLAKAEQKPSIN